MRSYISLLSALSAIAVFGVSAQDMPPDLACVDQCNNSNRDQFASLSCTSAEDRECLCTADNFQYSVRDCALASCPGTTEEQVQNWLGAPGNFCEGFTDDAPEESAATTAEEPAQTTTAAEETTAPAETTEVPATTTEPPAEETTSAVVESTTATPESTPASSTSSETSASETEASPPSSTAEENDEEAAAAAGGGLSQGAAVGIGVGVAVVVVAIAIVAIVLLMRKRKGNKQQQQQQQYPRGAGSGHGNISRPIQDPNAGIGRAYGGSDDFQFGEKRGESFEMTMTGHRYEDMVPRQTPRTMV